MKVLYTILLIVMFNTTALATVETMDGHYLQKECRKALIIMDATKSIPDSEGAEYAYSFGFCFSAVRTVLGINTLYESAFEGRALFCMMHKTVKFIDLITYIVKWTEDHPEHLQWNYDQVIVLALKDKHGCSTNMFIPFKCEENYHIKTEQ